MSVLAPARPSLQVTLPSRPTLDVPAAAPLIDISMSRTSSGRKSVRFSPEPPAVHSTWASCVYDRTPAVDPTTLEQGLGFPPRCSSDEDEDDAMDVECPTADAEHDDAEHDDAVPSLDEHAGTSSSGEDSDERSMAHLLNSFFLPPSPTLPSPKAASSPIGNSFPFPLVSRVALPSSPRTRATLRTRTGSPRPPSPVTRSSSPVLTRKRGVAILQQQAPASTSPQRTLPSPLSSAPPMRRMFSDESDEGVGEEDGTVSQEDGEDDGTVRPLIRRSPKRAAGKCAVSPESSPDAGGFEAETCWGSFGDDADCLGGF